MNNELWGRDIIKARGLFASNRYDNAKELLLPLLDNQNKNCVLDAKKMLIEISLVTEKELLLSLTYCKEILNEKLDIVFLHYIIEISTRNNSLSEIIEYIFSFKDKLDDSSTVAINLQIISNLLKRKIENDDLILRLLDDSVRIYKKIGILDEHFLFSRKYPSFSKLVDILCLINESNPNFKLDLYIKNKLEWVDETGKMIFGEKGIL